MSGPRPAASLSQLWLAAGFFVVVASMVVLLLVPPRLFVIATFVATTCMTLASVAVGGYSSLIRPSPKSIAVGLGIAVLLYLIFIAGNAGIAAMHPFGISSSNENSIYSLIASPSNPWYIQLLVLVFDAVGYESYFRGILQQRLSGRIGVAAPVATAALDAAIHLLSMNPLWVASTFIVDTSWGLGYRYTRDLTCNVVSHFVWDILIFVLFPIH
jgi:membrane protease YdiL (CAAX protease family)